MSNKLEIFIGLLGVTKLAEPSRSRLTKYAGSPKKKSHPNTAALVTKCISNGTYPLHSWVTSAMLNRSYH